MISYFFSVGDDGADGCGFQGEMGPTAYSVNHHALVELAKDDVPKQENS